MSLAFRNNSYVRSAARALIVENGCLLAIEMCRPGGTCFYILPGGGQAHGETLKETLSRECEEEIGVSPVIGKIAYVREYIGKNHLFSEWHRDFHQLEVVFHCSLPPGQVIRPGHETDRHQTGIRWIPLDRLAHIDFFPKILSKYVRGNRIDAGEIYLGDIN